MATTLTQLCSVTRDPDGTPHFRIENGLGDLVDGDLPFLEIFLFQIVDPVSAKADVFLRIASLTDLTSRLPRSRGGALSVAGTVYSQAAFSISYDDLETAVQGKQIIQARIDDLISSWRSYSSQFVSPSAITLPLEASSTVAAAKATLKRALADLATAQAAREELKTALAEAAATLASAQSLQTAAQARSEACAQLVGQLGTINSNYTLYASSMAGELAADQLFLGQAQAFSAAHADAPFSAQVATFATAVADAGSAQASAQTGLAPLLTTFTAELAAQCSNVAAELVQAKQSTASALRAASTAQTKAALAEAALAAAQAASNAALATVVNYCPGFNPATDL